MEDFLASDKDTSDDDQYKEIAQVISLISDDDEEVAEVISLISDDDEETSSGNHSPEFDEEDLDIAQQANLIIEGRRARNPPTHLQLEWDTEYYKDSRDQCKWIYILFFFVCSAAW